MENTESPVEKEEETNDATESETQQQKEETPPPQKPPKKPKFGIKRRKDGSIRTLVFKADTDHPVLVQTGIAGNIFLNIISFILFVVTVIASLYYIIILSKSEFHSDCTDTIMWANASYEAGSIYDPNFKYACFLPFGTNILMYPFIGITGLSLKTHIIGI